MKAEGDGFRVRQLLLIEMGHQSSERNVRCVNLVSVLGLLHFRAS